MSTPRRPTRTDSRRRVAERGHARSAQWTGRALTADQQRSAAHLDAIEEIVREERAEHLAPAFDQNALDAAAMQVVEHVARRHGGELDHFAAARDQRLAPRARRWTPCTSAPAPGSRTARLWTDA